RTGPGVADRARGKPTTMLVPSRCRLERRRSLGSRGGCHPNDGLIEVEAAGGAEEAGVAVGEGAASGRDGPVAGAARGGCHPNDGLMEVEAAGGAEEAGVAVGEDAAIGRDEPVAGAARGGCHPNDGLIEVEAAGGAEEAGIAVGE